MYHPIQSPDCQIPLDRFAEIIRLALAFALDNDLTTLHPGSGATVSAVKLTEALKPQLLRDNGGSSFVSRVHQNFIRHFDEHDNEPAGAWLWNKPVSIMAHLIHLLALPLDEKKDILTAFTEEMDLETRFNSGQLSYSALRKSDGIEQALALVESVMCSFYDAVLAKKGVRRDLIGEDDHFTRQQVLQAFSRANTGLGVCPGCDASPPRITDLCIHEDLDHFFPISKYPFLSVHLLNLTPLCMYCNQRFKGDKDPLDARGVSSLEDIYHPYFRPARDHIDVVVERDDVGIPHLYLKPRQIGPQHERRLESLNYLLCLRKQWDGELQTGNPKRRVRRHLLNITQDERPLHVGPDKTWIAGKMARVVDDLAEIIGEQPHSVVASAYARWVANDDIACSKLLEEASIALPTPVFAANFTDKAAVVPDVPV